MLRTHVNLACKAIIAAITNIDYAAADALEYVPPASSTFHYLLQIRASSERRKEFSDCVKAALDGKDLKLVWDMDVRWSSTLLMIMCALDLQEPIEVFLEEKLTHLQLDSKEWDALNVIQNILFVPYAFQQKLSTEKIPTLNCTIPIFNAMAKLWERLWDEDDMPLDAVDIINAGLDKLSDYRQRITDVPAYYLAITNL
ncbi:uncharacterized protein SCHCODRAFT_02495241 [Schizophyllum commune H4-8]|uniref:Uncharacterized protein n=1 Tax=Schizophyllum commune (strain H4-8 / FGSC 9210) TaxID=578458 RepID=D8Q3C2_SCHCM|nr:uncharacterized protein SCHCODRAFT_02495241 [Schizophyllum commune H4-8]KAI5894825.1 hypothetical protein SCHCODRAFT_02495241 [Schizophyllum commune H4-8]